MTWTRRFFNQFEWLHKPISPIEESFLLPLQIDNSVNIIFQRLGLKAPKNVWKIIEGYLYFSNEYWRLFLQPGLILLPSKIKSEIKNAKSRWLNQVIPKYESEITKLSKINPKGVSEEKLVDGFKRTAKLEGWLFGESLFVGVICGITELLLKITYSLLVKDSSPQNYRELLIGFPDKGLEMDTRLWDIAQIRDSKKKQIELEMWTSQYGYRIQDKDLLYLTLGENRELINSYLNLYKDIPNPRQKRKSAEEKRLAGKDYVRQNTRIADSMIQTIVKQAQEYAQIRNSRPYYYKGNKVMRHALLEIAARTSSFSDKNDIFFLRIEEVEKLVRNELKKEGTRNLIDRRKLEYERQLHTEPKFEVNL